VQAPDTLPLASVNTDGAEGKALVHAIEMVLKGLGKDGAEAITVSDSEAALKAFNALPFNGDGVITLETTTDETLQALIVDVIATVGGELDRSGQTGVSAVKVTAFFKAVADYLAWYERGTNEPALLPLKDDTAGALAALSAVRSKIDDFFVRVKLAAFDKRAINALNREEKEYYALAAQDLELSNDDIRRLPLAHVEATANVPLKEGINPAWLEAMETFAGKVVKPMLGDHDQLTEAQWLEIKSRLAGFEAWEATKTGTEVQMLGLERLRALAAPGMAAALDELFTREQEEAGTATAIASVERLVRYVRDMHQLACNFVNFRQFYEHNQPAIFQVGTLYLDQRSSELCLLIEDVGKHAGMAGLSRVFLAYCDCVRKATGEKMTIAAAFTNGDSDQLVVGRNGIFYDRMGKDWDAAIVRLVENPISLRESFLSPYKKLLRFIEEQVAKRAAASEAESDKLLTGTAEHLGEAAATGPSVVIPKKMDVGVVAAIGVAVGGLTAALGALLQTFFGLGIWMPLGIVGLVLVISGPSMMIAWLKLRQRSIGPLLDANGWALNATARINVPFGASLTRLAILPPGAHVDLADPFADKKRPWWLYVVLVLVLIAAYRYR